MEKQKIAEIAASLMRDRRSHPHKEVGNKYYHGLRVAKIALTLRKIVLPEDDSRDDILTAAAWMHDCANGERNYGNHAIEGAKLCRELLAGCCTPEEMDGICHIVAHHDDRSHTVEYDTWLKCHQDADHLDHFGSYDVMMAFLECNASGGTIDDMLKWMQYDRPAQMERVKAQLNFDVSRRIYEEKMAFMSDFALRYQAETDGEIVGLEHILDELHRV